MGAMHETIKAVTAKDTAKDIAKSEGVDIATIRFRWNAAFEKGTFDSNRELSPEEIAAISRNASTKRAATRKAAAKDIPATVNQPAPAKSDMTPAPGRAKQGWRYAVLVGLLIAPTAASVENMYQVTRAISESAHTAVFLTTVLSISALGFVVASGRTWYTLCLAGLLILFESFCNLTRIYGGLMGVGAKWNPTRFLGLVTDIFGSGSHQTAIFLAAFTAFFIAAVQYAAVFELNKSK